MPSPLSRAKCLFRFASSAPITAPKIAKQNLFNQRVSLSSFQRHHIIWDGLTIWPVCTDGHKPTREVAMAVRQGWRRGMATVFEALSGASTSGAIMD